MTDLLVGGDVDIETLEESLLLDEFPCIVHGCKAEAVVAWECECPEPWYHCEEHAKSRDIQAAEPRGAECGECGLRLPTPIPWRPV